MPNLISVAARFTRSVHIRHDFRDLRHRLDGYIVTPLVLQTTARIVGGLHPESRERAFSITGPFGAGKSAFGVFLTHFLVRNSSSRRTLLRSLHVDEHPLPLDVPSLVPVLVPGNNSSLRRALVQALVDALRTWHPNVSEQLSQHIAEALHEPALDPVQTAMLVEQTAQYLRAHSDYAGLVLIIDELGQYLDYAARHDDERDLFVLQTLAEMAARSGDAPVLVVTMLHQAFEHYTVYAGAQRRIEWAKVQGRFVDLAFQEPLSRMVRLIAAALRPAGTDPLREQRLQWAERMVPLTEALGLRPAEIGSHEWRQIVADSFPLHPMTMLALPGIVRQLAQNERSLFAFLASDEPWGLRDVTRQAPDGTVPIYRLSHLFNYVETNLGARLFARSLGRRWAELVEARADLTGVDPLLLDTLTVVGVLGVLERAAGMRACQSHVAFALTDDPSDPTVAAALATLQKRQHIIYRRFRDSFVLWEGSDLDLELLTQQARRTLAERYSLCQLLMRYADTTPRIAYRHSYRTGATRAFAVRYVDVQQLADTMTVPAGLAGELLCVVPSDEEELSRAEHWACHPDRRQETARIIVLPCHVHEMREMALDVAALRILTEEHEALEHDRVARREIHSRLIEAEQILRDTLAEAYGVQSRWFYGGQHVPVANARQIDDLLSKAADETYRLAPHIWNELVGRDAISSAAAKARRNVVVAMLEQADQALLGIQGYPPERAMYASILQRGGLHRQNEQGTWEIGPPPPSDPLRLLPVWHAIEAKLMEAGTQSLALAALYTLLQQPPYGIKAGIIPILFVAFYVARAGEMVFYEHGNYVPVPDMAMFERLLARPDYFAVRLCRAEGMRFVFYRQLAETFAPQALTHQVQPALLAVALPLLRTYHQLPAYSKQTKQLSPQTQAVRQALREARAPDELLFELLPLAFDVPPVSEHASVSLEQMHTFIEQLRQSMRELQEAFPRLRRTLLARTMRVFGLSDDGVVAHRELLQRYQRIAAFTNDTQLHALGARLETAVPDGEAWALSVAALVVKRPPDQWHDADVPVFHAVIADLARRFHAAEELSVTAPMLPSSSREVMRVGITNGNGEMSRVIHLSAQSDVQRLRSEVQALLHRYAHLSTEQQLGALAEVLQQLLLNEQQVA